MKSLYSLTLACTQTHRTGVLQRSQPRIHASMHLWTTVGSPTMLALQWPLCLSGKAEGRRSLQLWTSDDVVHAPSFCTSATLGNNESFDEERMVKPHRQSFGEDSAGETPPCRAACQKCSIEWSPRWVSKSRTVTRNVDVDLELLTSARESPSESRGFWSCLRRFHSNFIGAGRSRLLEAAM